MIFITGATGFLGAHITAKLLGAGQDVRLLRRPSSSTAELESIVKWVNGKNLLEFESQIEWIEGDILDLHALDQSCKGVEAVIHCAATVSFSKSDEDRMNKINIEGTENVVNTCLKAKIPRLVHISSTSALSHFKKEGTIDESCDYIEGEPNSKYGISKFKAEMAVWRAMEEGLNAVILNPAVILGYGDWDKGSCNLFKKYAHGFPFYSTGGNAFIGVEDVAQISVDMLNSEIASERFLCVSENLDFKDLFFMMADQFGQKRPHIKINKIRSELAWRLFAIANLFRKKALITKESAAASVRKTEYSNAKLSGALDFQFRPINEVVEKAVAAYRA